MTLGAQSSGGSWGSARVAVMAPVVSSMSKQPEHLKVNIKAVKILSHLAFRNEVNLRSLAIVEGEII